MICQKNKCTGCYACYNICPQKAIELVEDEYGYIYPIINKKKCINCNLCKKVCPQIKDSKRKGMHPSKTFAAYSNNQSIRDKSTSGGIATLISKAIIENNGVVYGASNLFDSDAFCFERINNVNDLYRIQGSKYVHCYINGSYKLVKNDLINKKNVLFIGTPCQIDGLKSFLLKEYENLYTIDIICHGVPSQKILFENLKIYNIDKKDFKMIRFRDNKGFNLSLYKTYEDFKNDIPIKSIYANQDFFYKNFLRGNIYRDNCYECKYANDKRIADVTLGDFWGLDKNSISYDNEKLGISVIMCNTPKGEYLFNSIKKEITYDERNFLEAQKNNGQLNNPMIKSRQYYIFKKNYLKLGFFKTMKKMNMPKDYLKYNCLYKNFKKIKEKLFN